MSQKTHGSNLKYGIGFLTLALCLLTVTTAQAASLFWNPIAGGNGTWDTSSTICGSTTWASPPSIAWATSNTDDATFRGGVAGNITVDAGGIKCTTYLSVIPAETTANTYTFSGGQITFGGTPRQNVIGVANAADSLTINSPISATSLYFNNNFGSGAGGNIYGNGTSIENPGNTIRELCISAATAAAAAIYG